MQLTASSSLSACVGVVFFSNFKDQRLYKQTSPEVEPVAITPPDSGEYDINGAIQLFVTVYILQGLRFADYHSVPGKKYMVAVREDHGVVTSRKAKEPENVIVSVNVDSGDQAVLVSCSTLLCKFEGQTGGQTDRQADRQIITSLYYK